MLITRYSVESSAPRGTWTRARENIHSQRSTTPTSACNRRRQRSSLELSLYNGLCRKIMLVSRKLPFTALKITFLCLIFSNVFTISRSSIAAGGQTSSEIGYELSLLEYDPILLSEESDIQENGYDPNLDVPSAGSSDITEDNPHSETINMDGFNLLWLVASKLESNDKLQSADDKSKANTSSTNHFNQSDNNSTNTNNGNEIYLNSAWPRSYLRYGRADVPISRVQVSSPDKSAISPPALAQTLSDFLDRPNVDKRRRWGHEIVTHRNLYDDPFKGQNGIMNGKSIGFEMEFRVEDDSGSGYIITGKSVVGQPYFTTVDSTQNVNQTLSEHQSWFGLSCMSRNSEYVLRLEYRNAASNDKTPQQFVLVDGLRKGTWQKLAVTIDFDDNTVNYWVNCSAKPLKQLRESIDHPSSLYSIYRLLQHRRHSTTPVEVTFRSAVVTDGHHRDIPKQCEEEQVIDACNGGRIYMTCGPSCERTCEGIHSPQMTDKYLRTCAIACVSGCHCRPGYVTYNDTCVKPEQCPCLIGDVSYEPGQNVTINNELCSCSKGGWQCYSPPRMTQGPRNQSMILGQSTQLTCTVSGNPQPTITWEVPTGSHHRIVSKDFGRVSSVELRTVSTSESGMYTCRAHLPTTGWEYVATANVDVNSPPKISLLSAIPITSGHHVLSIDCTVTGLPSPEIYWIRHDGPVIPSDHIDVNKSPGLSRLKIHNVQRSDAGEWSCRARNKAGYAIKTVRILVRLPEPNNMAFSRKPVNQYVKRGHAAVFMCKMVSNPSAYNMTWLKDGVRLNFTTKRVAMKTFRLVIKKVRDEDAGTYTCVVRLKRGGSELRAKAELMIKGRMLSWSEWSKCSASCGKGLMFKRRTCTGVPPNKKTCHGEFARLKSCNTQTCPGTCSVYGDPHYTTFDGRKFNFHGECGYTLSEDVVGNDFKVYLYNEDCGMGMNCLSRVTVMLSKRGLGAVVEIEKTGLVTVNGVRMSLPHVSKDSLLVVDKIGLYIIVNAGSDFELKWAIPHRLYLIVGPRYFDRTQGFCGNFNGDPTDDNILRSGRQASSDLEFALNWAVRDGSSNHSCSAFLEPLTEPCRANPTLYESAHGICGFLNNQETFSHCHRKVPPERFIETCEFDICRTSENNINTYFCTAISAYAEECLRNGVVLDWRKDDFCLESCDGGKVYEECGPRCVRYCPGIVDESGTVCSSNEACVSGCHCPRHLVLHEGRCIRPQRCPCVHRGVPYRTNSTLDRNCEKCICKSGKWKCAFNKALCEFPSSIIKGPVPQVVPQGRSVSFCCEVAGIPKPTVEWYRDGRVVPPQTDEATQTNIHADGTLQDGYVKSYYHIANLTKYDEGPYYCKATNKLGSQISETVSLTVVEPWMATCNPVPRKRIVTLPEGCRRGAARELNVGHCPSLPCYYERPTGNNQRLRRKDRCGGTKQCCRPSHLQPVLVRCTEAGRDFPLYITTITKCSCSICESTYTIVEGALLTAMTGKLLNDVKIDYQGRVVGYTSKTGSFNLKLRSLPEDPRHIALTFTDILHKRFPITVKNLPIIVGETTTHKVLVNGHGFKLRFDANLGLKHQFRSTVSRNKDRLRIIIPPRSVVLQQAMRPYIGRVDAIISIVEKNYELDRRKLDAIPGDFVAVDRRGNKQILQPSYVVSVSLFSQYGKPLDLLPERAATFLVTSVTLGNRMQPWVLDELTGLWREGETKVQMHPNFNKRGEKILLLAAKIPRINTAWALSDSEDACYVRVRALDRDNNTVAGVRFVMTTTSELPRHNTRSRRTSKQATQLSTVVESLTRSSDTNGICMPIGCEKFGFITAAKLANELAPLLPDEPLPELGLITTRISPAYGVSNPVIQTLSAHESNNIDRRDTDSRQPTLYFANEDQCRTTVADRRTYVFRDTSQKEVSGYHEASRRAALAATTRVTPTHYYRPPSPRKKYYCHIKVAVILPELHRPVGNLMSILAATFNGRNSNGSMSSIGWRRTSFRTPVSRPSQPKPGQRSTARPRIRRVLNEYCVEYLCGEDTQADVAYVTMKQLKEGFTKGNTPLQCRFVRSANMAASRAISNQRNTNPTKGGYVVLPPVRVNYEAGSSLSRKVTRVYPQLAFQDRLLLASKKKCLRAHGSAFTSAWIRCT